MIEKLIQWDRDLFLFLNNMNMDAFDPVMMVLSSYTSFIVVCALIILFAIWKNRKEGAVMSVFFLLTIGFNNLTNQIVKRIIERPRPIHEESFQDIIHSLGIYETGFSFYSGHSTTAFCIAVFSLLYFKNRIYTWVALIWAFGVAYSRIYMGKHYPLDVFSGMLAGCFLAFLGFKLFEYYKEKKLTPQSRA